MKRIYFAILIIFSSLSCANLSDNKNDSTKNEKERIRIVKLNLKSQTELASIWNDSLKSYSNTFLKAAHIEYDRQGNRILEIKFNKQTGKEHSKIESTYDLNNKLESFINYYKDGTFRKMKYEYNADGNEISSIYYSMNGEILLKKLKEYSSNILQKEIVFGSKNNDTVEVSYFNENGKRIGRINYNSNIFTKKHKYQWSNDEMKVVITEFDKDDKLRKIETKYFDKQGNEIKTSGITPTPRDSLINYHTYKYDSNGNKTQEVWYRPNNDTLSNTSIKLNYDLNGNLDEAFLKQNGNPIMKTKYKYEYWE